MAGLPQAVAGQLVQARSARPRAAPFGGAFDRAQAEGSRRSLDVDVDASLFRFPGNRPYVGFEEAITVFGDPQALTIFDEEHSDPEDRYVNLGRSSSGRVIVVVYTERGESIRIISCRKATFTERRQYEQQDT